MKDVESDATLEERKELYFLHLEKGILIHLFSWLPRKTRGATGHYWH